MHAMDYVEGVENLRETLGDEEVEGVGVEAPKMLDCWKSGQTNLVPHFL